MERITLLSNWTVYSHRLEFRSLSTHEMTVRAILPFHMLKSYENKSGRLILLKDIAGGGSAAQNFREIILK